ncbi:MAG: hypothetical protein Q9219_006937, partial [cf. Caloplaca sp. 3 TL-2023]
FLPADAMWNLMMAINVYLTIFYKYNAKQLKALEWKYHVVCYGLPFIVALTCLLIDPQPRGRIYGPATLWCWIPIQWVGLRIALVYGPAWVAIFLSFTLYIISGREIFKKRRQLRAFRGYSSSPIEIEDPFTSFKTTEVAITHEPAKLAFPTGNEANIIFPCSEPEGDKQQSSPSKSYDQYSVKISSTPISPIFGASIPTAPTSPESAAVISYRTNRAAVEANTAAWGYTKVALLFFVSLLITWVPSSINRVYSLIHPDLISIPFSYASAVVLPLMGWWNAVIYFTTSWNSCKDLFFKYYFIASAARIVPLPSTRIIRLRERAQETNGIAVKKPRTQISVSDSLRGLALRDVSNMI